MLWEPNFEYTRKWELNVNNAVLQRFVQKIDGFFLDTPYFDVDRCYLWTGAGRKPIEGLSHKGRQHGTFNCNQTLIPAHRLIYILTYGIPNDVVHKSDPCPCGSEKVYKSCCRFEVRHQCITITNEDHNGLCVNPLHLKLGDHSANQHDIRIDGTGKGKISAGEKHHKCSITEEIARNIWSDLQTGIPQKTIQEKHSLPTKNIVKDISRGKTWTHITGKNRDKHNKLTHKRNEQKYRAECRRRKRVLESKGFVYYGDVYPDSEEDDEVPVEEKTERICTNPKCSFKGEPQDIENFVWKTKERKSRRTQCKTCKNQEQVAYRAQKLLKEGRTPSQSKEISTKQTTIKEPKPKILDGFQMCPRCLIQKPTEKFKGTRKDSSCDDCVEARKRQQKKESAQKIATAKKFADSGLTEMWTCKDCGYHGPEGNFYSKENCWGCRKEYMKNYKKKPQPSRSQCLGATEWTCACCTKLFPIDQFSTTKLRKDSTCKECKRQKFVHNSQVYRDKKGLRPEKAPLTEWTCCVCHQLLPIDNFNATNPSRKSKCKPCQNEWHKQDCKRRREENK